MATTKRTVDERVKRLESQLSELRQLVEELESDLDTAKRHIRELRQSRDGE